MKSSSRAHDKDLQSLTDAYTNIMESRDQSNNIKHTQDQAYKQGKYDFGAGVTGSQAKLESKKFGNFSEQYIRGRSDAREEFGRPPEPKEAPVSDEDRNEMEGIIFGDKEMVPEEDESERFGKAMALSKERIDKQWPWENMEYDHMAMQLMKYKGKIHKEDMSAVKEAIYYSLDNIGVDAIPSETNADDVGPSR